MVEEAKKKALYKISEHVYQWTDTYEGTLATLDALDDLISAVREDELRRATKPDIIDTLKTSRY